MASLDTHLIVKVLQISRKCCKYICTCIFISLSTELTGLNHGDECGLELKSILSYVDCWSSRMLAVIGAENSHSVLSAIASRSGSSSSLGGSSSIVGAVSSKEQATATMGVLDGDSKMSLASTNFFFLRSFSGSSI
jgi:hypothetical protein